MNIRIGQEEWAAILTVLKLKEKEIFRVGFHEGSYYRFVKQKLQVNRTGNPDGWSEADSTTLAAVLTGEYYIEKFPTAETKIQTVQRLYQPYALRKRCLDNFCKYLQNMKEKEFDTFIKNFTYKQTQEFAKEYFDEAKLTDTTPILCAIENEKNRRTLEKWINKR